MNRFFKSIITLAVASTFSVVPIQNAVAWVGTSAYENVLDSVLENNVQKMSTNDNISSYGNEFVLDYVTTSHDYYETVDVLNQVQELSDSLCEGISNDYERLERLHDYVCDTVAYDYIAKENFANLDTICLKNVLENHRTICAGYANLFSALCNAQGMYCVNVRGAVSTSEYSLDDDNAPTNHEWNAVWLESESRWVYVDCTWDSTYVYDEDGFRYTNDTSKHVRTYFDMSMEKMSENHKVRIITHWDFSSAVDYLSSTTSEAVQTLDTTSSSIAEATTTTDTQTTAPSLATTTNTDDSSNYTTKLTVLIISTLLIIVCIVQAKRSTHTE